MSNNKRFWKILAPKGYLLALGLCAIALGVAGLVYTQRQEAQPVVAEDTVPIHATIKNPRPAGDPAADSQNTQTDATNPTGDITPPATEPARLQTMWPLEGQVCAAFAADHLTYNLTTRDWRVHEGLDLEAAAGTPVVAAAAGTVLEVCQDDHLGTLVRIRHTGGYVTTYASLAEDVAVVTGQTVSMGQVLGTVGKTALTEKALGDHLHFAVEQNGTPLDPQEFLS